MLPCTSRQLGLAKMQPTGRPKRVGITIGPQYGTVSPSFIKDAAREANRTKDLDLLCVLAFAFDPSVLGTGEDYVASDIGFANVAAERRLGDSTGPASAYECRSSNG